MSESENGKDLCKCKGVREGARAGEREKPSGTCFACVTHCTTRLLAPCFVYLSQLFSNVTKDLRTSTNKMLMLQLRGRTHASQTPCKKLQVTHTLETPFEQAQPASHVRLFSSSKSLMRRHHQQRGSTEVDKMKMWQEMHQGKELYNQLQ